MEEIKEYKDINDKIDHFERIMVDNYPLVQCPLKHEFTDGMYIREIFMPAGTWVTSMIHKTKHPYFIMEGLVSVFSENDGEQLLGIGDRGITMPNTRRVLYIHEDCRWVTCHACTDGETVDQIEDRIIDKRQNLLFSEEERDVLKLLHKWGIDIELTDKKESQCHG